MKEAIVCFIQIVKKNELILNNMGDDIHIAEIKYNKMNNSSNLIIN